MGPSVIHACLLNDYRCIEYHGVRSVPWNMSGSALCRRRMVLDQGQCIRTRALRIADGSFDIISDPC